MHCVVGSFDRRKAPRKQSVQFRLFRLNTCSKFSIQGVGSCRLLQKHNRKILMKVHRQCGRDFCRYARPCMSRSCNHDGELAAAMMVIFFALATATLFPKLRGHDHECLVFVAFLCMHARCSDARYRTPPSGHQAQTRTWETQMALRADSRFVTSCFRS